MLISSLWSIGTALHRYPGSQHKRNQDPLGKGGPPFQTSHDSKPIASPTRSNGIDWWRAVLSYDMLSELNHYCNPVGCDKNFFAVYNLQKTVL